MSHKTRRNIDDRFSDAPPASANRPIQTAARRPALGLVEPRWLEPANDREADSAPEGRRRLLARAAALIDRLRAAMERRRALRLLEALPLRLQQDIGVDPGGWRHAYRFEDRSRRG